MVFRHKIGGDLGSGMSWISEPGTYHILITNLTTTVLDSSGSLIDNAAFKIDVSVLDGTDAGQKNKIKGIVFKYPKPSDKKDGAFAKRKMDRFFLATGLETREQLEKKDQEIDIDLDKCIGRQFVAKFERDRDQPQYVNLSFTDIYHVDDPAVKEIPKDKDSLALIDPALRWVGNKAPKKETPKKESQPVADASGSDYSDL